jgi:hypothetical protein
MGKPRPVVRRRGWPDTTIDVRFREADHADRRCGYRFHVWEAVEWADVHAPLQSAAPDAVAANAVFYMDDNLMREPPGAWVEGDPSTITWFDDVIVWPPD